MIERNAYPILKKLAKSFPIVALTGPRQSGKTTLVRHVFSEMPYVSLENPDNREFATTDPNGFLAQYPEGAILDEVQRCPDLFSYLQGIVDESKRPGQFILTGSQQFGLISGITQSLAGRVALISLLPFVRDELARHDSAPFSISEALFKGLYPPVYDRDVDPVFWYNNYINTYIERDVRQLVSVKDLTTFQRFVKSCAARTGQLLNYSSLATDCGITVPTVKAWLSVLEASYLIYLLPPHFNNFNKRLTKSPKLYFWDTGIACRLLGIQEHTQLDHHPLRGELFETLMVGELMKARFNKGLPSNLYFWRDKTGNEVDVIIDVGGRLHPVEIKSGQTITKSAFDGLSKWCELAGDQAGYASIIYGGESQTTRQNTQVISWGNLTALTSDL